ncbi:MAG: SGNH/GDSL hydrolase family protein, partial [Oscillospiraceae bacterium]|nr:SGNH/GDSL hydrolase family protein [Oscillospiraceae bacterium]
MNSSGRILLVGDSIAKGVTYDASRGRYVLPTENISRLVEKATAFVIENIARFGATVDMAAKDLTRWFKRGSEPRPDVVAIEIGGNDCNFDWEAIARDPKAEHLPKTGLEEFERTLEGMIDEVRAENIMPVLCNLPPIDADRYFRYFTGGDADKGERILEWLGSVGRIYWWHERYSVAVEEVAESADVPLINIRGALLREPDYRAFVAADGLHLNEEGQR